MTIEKLNEEIESFRNSKTEQGTLRLHLFNYENKYIKARFVETSNAAGGKEIINGKQWSILFELKENFQHFPKWKMLLLTLKDRINITEVKYGQNIGCWGMRLYHLSKNPTNEIIKKILDFIFLD
jgi:hypothetical protein